MIECPKCGFIQPDDRYCANCGLDIQTYKPKERPWYILLVRSPLFQASVSGVVILFLVMSLFRTQTTKIETRISQFQNSLDQVDDELAKSQTPVPHSDAKPAPPRPVAKIAAPVEATTPARVADQPPADDPKPVPIVLPDTVNVMFFETPRELLTSVLQDAQSLAILPTVQVFNLSNVDKLKSLVTNARRLPGSTSGLELKGTAAAHVPFLFYSSSEGRAESGLQIEIAPPEAAPAAATGEGAHRFATRIKGSVVGLQRGSETQEIRVQMDELVVTSTDQPIAILGLIPNTISLRAPASELAASPFVILASQNFQQSYTDALVVIQFESSH